MTDSKPTVYHSGAHDGLIMGSIFTAVFLSSALNIVHPTIFMALLSTVLSVPGVIVFAYILLRRRYREDRCASHISSIWMHGIVMCICGCLIMGIVAFIFMRFVAPDFIVKTFRTAAEAYYAVGTPEADNIAHVFETMITKHMLPTPIKTAFTLMWLGSFLGALLSLVLALIIKFTVKYKFF